MNRSSRGFTLLEMMVALGILSAAYVALMQAQSASIRLSTYGKHITVATFLAQTKIEEIEEELTREGFPDMDDTDEGNFEELGYSMFGWTLEVNKVELPLGEAFSQMLTRFGGGEDGEGGVAGGMGGIEEMLGGQLGGQMGDQLKSQLGGMMGGGGAGGGLSGMLNPDMLKGQVDMLADTLEQSLREVRLTVFWEGGGPGKELVLTTHLVQVPGGSSVPGAGQPGGLGQQPGTNPADALKGIQKPGGTRQPGPTGGSKGTSGTRLPGGLRPGK